MFKNVVAKHVHTVVYAGAAILLALLVCIYAQDIGWRAFNAIASNQGKNLESYLDKEKRYILETVSGLAVSEDLVRLLRDEDANGISVFLSKQKELSGLTALTVANEHGTALSRVPIKANLGDNVFLTIAAGRKVARGDFSAGYGPGRNFPLTLGAGALVKDGNEAVGAVFAGYWLNNDYAQNFKRIYLDDIRRREVIFYSKEEGITGNSFEDVETRSRLRAYLNHASAIIQDGQSGYLISVGGKDYVVTNYLFSGESEIYGGVLVLTPIPFPLLLRSMIVSLLAALLFFGSLLIIEHISIPQLLRFRRKRLYLFLIILAGFMFVSLWVSLYTHGRMITLNLEKPPLTIYNSTMKIRPGTGVYVIGHTQQASIAVYSGGEKVNAIDASLRFDPDVIRVDRLSFERSLCSEDATIEHEIDNAHGTLRISCAVLEDVFSDPRAILADIEFTPLSAGSASIVFDEGTSVLAADGLGTDVLRSVTPAFYRVFEEDDISNVFSKNSITIPFSPSHENSRQWYSNRRVRVTWPSMKGVEYVYEFTKNASSTLENSLATSANEITLNAPSDGVYYFRIAPQKDGVRGLTSTLTVMIDTTPPDIPNIKTSTTKIKKNGIVRFELASNDTLSGLQKNFYVRIGSTVWLPTFAKLYMPFRDVGEQRVGVRVFDNAENFSDSEVIINVTR